MSGKALLVLSDGVVFEGRNFGSQGETTGEVVFNTSMTGYQEILTDPSYKGQIVTMTYSQIGNYGVNEEDIESLNGPKVEGFVVREAIDFPSNWRSNKFGVRSSEFRADSKKTFFNKANTGGYSLGDYLKDHGIVGIECIDTRALTRHLRDYGAQMGIISTVDPDPRNLLAKVRAHPGISAFDLVKDVTTTKEYKWSESVWKWKGEDARYKMQDASLKDNETKSEMEKVISDSQLRTPNSELKRVVVYDFGVKFNILRNLADAGFDVTVVPAQTPAEAVFEMKPDGVVLSNGPGDPQTVTYGIENAKKMMGRLPVFGICLGHQILGLAMGGITYKLKFGHHGGNHPVKDLVTGKVEITSQNHNYCVDIKSLKGQVSLTHKNLYDGTEEGMQHVDLPVFSVQHHPEAGPGPNDAAHIFRRFRDKIEGNI